MRGLVRVDFESLLHSPFRSIVENQQRSLEEQHRVPDLTFLSKKSSEDSQFRPRQRRQHKLEPSNAHTPPVQQYEGHLLAGKQHLRRVTHKRKLTLDKTWSYKYIRESILTAHYLTGARDSARRRISWLLDWSLLRLSRALQELFVNLRRRATSASKKIRKPVIVIYLGFKSKHHYWNTLKFWTIYENCLVRYWTFYQ